MSPADGATAVTDRERVLVLVKGARDEELTVGLLTRAGLAAWPCSSAAELCDRIEEGDAAAAVLEEGVLSIESVEALSRALRRQPPWSDFPIVVFSAAGGSVRRGVDVATALGNVTFIDPPVRARTMVASIQAAIRSRRRQYQGRQAIESRDVFLAMLGHELRNPLGAIRLALSVLDGREDLASTPKEYGVIDRQTKHLTRLVDDLLDVARVTRGKVVLQRARLELVGTVQSAFEALEGRARAQGLDHVFRSTVTEAWVDGDRQRLDQVFANVLVNAIKYTPRGGTVRVDVGSEAGLAIVEVTDTGVGIAREMLDRVFEAFTQADRTLDRTQGGIGLGLALVRSVVELHGGTVEARSEGPGKGSTFRVCLPLVAPARMTEASPSAADETPSRAMRVVVVEDSGDIRDLFTELLEQGGHDVACAKDGPEGLDKILTLAPDIAFVDVGLPGFDGFELARRARGSGSTTRLVAVTGYGQPEDRRQAASAGFDEHLTKPVDRVDVVRAMARLATPEETVADRR